jgi:hypothetical protein
VSTPGRARRTRGMGSRRATTLTKRTPRDMRFVPWAAEMEGKASYAAKDPFVRRTCDAVSVPRTHLRGTVNVRGDVYG